MQFKDKNNNTFNIAITMGKVKKIKNELGIDLLNLFNKQENLEQINDPLTLVDLLYFLCEDQIAKAYKDEKEPDVAFGEALDMQILEEAGEVFMDALIDFFPDAKKKKLLRIKQTAVEMTAREDAQLDAKLEEVLAEMKSGQMSEDVKP